MAQQTLSASAVIALTMKGFYQGQTVLNVFHYKNITGTGYVNGDDELNNIITKFRNIVWAPITSDGIKAQLVDTYELLDITAQQVNPARNYYISQLVGETGAQAVAGVPSNTTLTVSFRTSRAIRGTTGNKKFTALPTSKFDGNQWTLAARTAWAGVGVYMLTTFKDLMTVDAWQPTVWSPARPSDRADVVAGDVHDDVRTLHRRQLRQGI